MASIGHVAVGLAGGRFLRRAADSLRVQVWTMVALVAVACTSSRWRQPSFSLSGSMHCGRERSDKSGP